ncbi:MAG: hypothetical protein CMN30_22825 [Sandaracinus sp.]|nr:hypothetical protein [Sandaracinus sp.]
MTRHHRVLLVLLAGCQGVIGAGGPDPDERTRDDARADALGEPCAAELEVFERTVWRPLLAVRCAGCHQAEGPAASTRMVFVDEEADDALATNYRAARRAAVADADGLALLLAKPGGVHSGGHQGGALLALDSIPAADARAFVASARTETCDPPPPLDCSAPPPGSPRLRRLTPAEYDATVADLLGIPSEAGATFPADEVRHGFDNAAEALVVSSLFADQLRLAAEELAERAPIAALTECGAGCGAESFVRAFGERAFRRPLTEVEVGRYVGLAAGAPEPSEGARLVVEAMLQSPHFLYRRELGVPDGSAQVLDGWEIASQLSYLLWGTMPDQALFAAARDGTLETLAGIETETRRLLASPRAVTARRRFVTRWLGLDRLATVAKDEATYPGFDPARRAALADAALAAIDEVLAREGTLDALLTASMPGSDDRRGLLELEAVLAVHARPNDSSPIHRGLFVRERLLCQELPPPPPGLVVEPPPVDPTRTARERYAAHSSAQPCEGCHRLIDPIGFAFEGFDGVGARRSAVVDLDGAIVGSLDSDGAIRGTTELGAHLAAGDEVADCFTLQWFRWAYGADVDERSRCQLEALRERFRGAHRSVDDLLVALATAPHVRRRGGE